MPKIRNRLQTGGYNRVETGSSKTGLDSGYKPVKKPVRLKKPVFLYTSTHKYESKPKKMKP
jgi:hypothetical protein